MADFIPGVGGYDAWAAAGKPVGDTSARVTGMSPAWYSLITKSGKVSKTTGYSPRQTAIDKFIQKALDDAAKNLKKGQETQDKAQQDAENKAAAEHKKAMDAIAANVAAENAISQKQQVEGKSIERQGQVPSGTPGFGPTAAANNFDEAAYQQMLKDVGKEGMVGLQMDFLKQQHPVQPGEYSPAWLGPQNAGVPNGLIPGSKEAQVANAAGIGPFPTFTGQASAGPTSPPPGSPPTSSGGTPTPPIQPSGGGPGSSGPTGAMAANIPQDKRTQDLLKQLQTATQKRMAQQQHHKTPWSSWGDFLSYGPTDLASDLGNGLNYLGTQMLGAGAEGVSFLGRGGSAAENVVQNLIDRIKSTGENLSETALSGRAPTPSLQVSAPSFAQQAQSVPLKTGPEESLAQAAVKGLAGHAETSGYKILKSLGVPDVPVVTPALGMGVDVGLDPTTYFSGEGLTKILPDVIKGAKVEHEVDLATQVAKQAMQAISEKGISAANKKLIERGATKGMANMNKAIPDIAPAQRRLVAAQQHAYAVALENGGNEGEAMFAAKHAGRQHLEAAVAQQVSMRKAEIAAQRNAATIGLKIAGKNLPTKAEPITKLVAQAQKLNKSWLNTPIGDAIHHAFSNNAWFPGNTQRLYFRARNRGAADLQMFQRDVMDHYKGLSGAEKRRINFALEHGEDLHGVISNRGGKDLGDVADWTRQKYDEMFNRSRDDLGKYEEGERAQNYVHHEYLKVGGKDLRQKIATIKKGRKWNLQNNGGADLYTLEDAQRDGLRPIMEADRSLVAGYTRESRRLVHNAFLRDITDKYGVVTDKAAAAQALGLQKIPASLRPAMYRIQSGHELYMHPEVRKMLEHEKELYTANPHALNPLLQYFDKAQHGWKFFNTVVNPGHHIRNTISDMYLNWLDGMKNPKYYKDAAQLMNPKARANMVFRVGNQQLTGDQLWRLYMDSGTPIGFTGMDLKAGKFNFEKHMYNMAEKREEWGRAAHYLYALQDEGDKAALGALNKAGLHKASYAAADRVSKYNFDYSNLTPFERNVAKRIVPFYTWTRKSTPLMLETMLMHPSKVTAVDKFNRFIENSLGTENSDNMNEFPYPPWLRQLSFARLSGGPEPTELTLPLPTTDIQRTFGGGPLQNFRSIVNMATPAAKIPFELATQRKVLSGAPLGDPWKYLENQFAFYNTATAANPAADKSELWRLGKLAVPGLNQSTVGQTRSELQRRMDTVTPGIKQINKAMYPFSIEKLKDGYAIYDNRLKKALPGRYKTEADAVPIAINAGKRASADPTVKQWITAQNG